MRLVIDGNDGTGKSTLVAVLQKIFDGAGDVWDRGIPTKMTDYYPVIHSDDELYIILDVPVEVSRERLAAAGKDLTERYHTVEDLTHYRQRFREVAEQLGPTRCRLVDASGTPDETLQRAVTALFSLVEERERAASAA